MKMAWYNMLYVEVTLSLKENTNKTHHVEKIFRLSYVGVCHTSRTGVYKDIDDTVLII